MDRWTEGNNFHFPLFAPQWGTTNLIPLSLKELHLWKNHSVFTWPTPPPFHCHIFFVLFGTFFHLLVGKKHKTKSSELFRMNAHRHGLPETFLKPTRSCSTLPWQDFDWLYVYSIRISVRTESSDLYAKEYVRYVFFQMTWRLVDIFGSGETLNWPSLVKRGVNQKGAVYTAILTSCYLNLKPLAESMRLCVFKSMSKGPAGGLPPVNLGPFLEGFQG